MKKGERDSADTDGTISRRDFLKMIGAGVAGLALGGCVSRVGARLPDTGRRTLILGFDGLDPTLLKTWMKSGDLPNFAHLARNGSFEPLRSSNPPHSPVAWSNFITGMDPSGHGIYDFIHRDPANYGPHLSTSTTQPAEHTLSMGDWIIPISPADVKLWRKGPAFWNILDDHNIPATMFRIPSNFPPEDSRAHSLSGLGTPDLQGSYGHFSYYTTQPPEGYQDMSGGSVYPVRVENGTVRASLRGPDNGFRKSQDVATVDFTVHVDQSNPVARIDIQGEKILLKEGDWSDWVHMQFKMAPAFATVSGICRFYMKSVHPFKLYVTPVNIDPSNPALPVSTPESYAAELHENLGPFYTQGMPEDTKALSNGVFTEDEFLQQARFVYEETVAGLEYELARFRDGILFAYFSTTDLVVHMFWRTMDQSHPLWTPELGKNYSHVIKDVYRRMDGVLGRCMKAVDDDTLVMVMSDHGFSPYRRSFDLNSWLLENDYLRAEPDTEQATLQTADWARSDAYGIGFNGLYINQAGREARGSVSPGPQKEKLLKELKERLLQLRDPETGETFIHSVRLTNECFQERPSPEVAPDALIGFERGYRGSWETAIGDSAPAWLTDNTGKWSGDHCLDSDVVPGSLLCNREVTVDYPALYDLAPTILAEYDIRPPSNMKGKPILKRS